jgi:hypothetical protein
MEHRQAAASQLATVITRGDVTDDAVADDETCRPGMMSFAVEPGIDHDRKLLQFVHAHAL